MRAAAACCGLVLLLAATARAADGPNFKPFTSKEGGFTVSLPGKPQQSTSSAKTDLGPVEMHEVAGTAKDKTTYAVVYCELPAELAKQGDPEKLLDRIRDGGAASVHGKPIKETKITLGDNPGREIEIDGLGGTRLWRLYLVGGRLYQLLVAPDSGRPPSERAKKFFDSFKLDEK